MLFVCLAHSTAAFGAGTQSSFHQSAEMDALVSPNAARGPWPCQPTESRDLGIPSQAGCSSPCSGIRQSPQMDDLVGPSSYSG